MVAYVSVASRAYVNPLERVESVQECLSSICPDNMLLVSSFATGVEC